MLFKSFILFAAIVASVAVTTSADIAPSVSDVKCGNLHHLREHHEHHDDGHKKHDSEHEHHDGEDHPSTKKPCKKGKHSKGDNVTETSDDKVFYVAPGKGSCGITYRDMSMVACLDNYWMNKTEQNSCQRFVKVTNPLTNITVQVQALDTCGAVNGTFGNNDIYLSKKPFMMLSGTNASATLNAGNLGANVTWSFVQASCESCYQGIIARDADHKIDPCQGPDAMGNMRCGRKHRDQRVLGTPALSQVCKPDYQCESGGLGTM